MVNRFIRTTKSLWENSKEQLKYNNSIVFIEDLEVIWSNGIYYGTNQIKKITRDEFIHKLFWQQLILGKLYQITDYKFDTKYRHTSSANHKFDLVLCPTGYELICAGYVVRSDDNVDFITDDENYKIGILYDCSLGKIVYMENTETRSSCKFDYLNLKYHLDSLLIVEAPTLHLYYICMPYPEKNTTTENNTTLYAFDIISSVSYADGTFATANSMFSDEYIIYCQDEVPTSNSVLIRDSATVDMEVYKYIPIDKKTCYTFNSQSAYNTQTQSYHATYLSLLTNSVNNCHVEEPFNIFLNTGNNVSVSGLFNIFCDKSYNNNIDNSYLNIFRSQTEYTNLDRSCFNVFNAVTLNCILERGCHSNNFNQVTNLKLNYGCYNNTFNGDYTSNVELKHGCYNNQTQKPISYTTIGYNCRNIQILSLAENINIRHSCDTIILGNSDGSGLISDITLGHTNMHSEIQANTNNINTYPRCSNVKILEGSSDINLLGYIYSSTIYGNHITMLGNCNDVEMSLKVLEATINNSKGIRINTPILNLICNHAQHLTISDYNIYNLEITPGYYNFNINGESGELDFFDKNSLKKIAIKSNGKIVKYVEADLIKDLY